MGWAERAKKRRQQVSNFGPLTGEHCLAIANTIKAGAAFFGLQLAGTDLGRMLRDAERFSRRRGDIFAATDTEDRRAKATTARAFLRVEQARRIGHALLMLQRVGKSEHLVKWLRKRIDRHEPATDERPRDHLFEIEIAGRLAKWNPVSVAFEEPDLVFGSPDGRFRAALACKRPHSMNAVGSRIRDGTQQLQRSGLPGIVVVNLEPLFHWPEDPGRPTFWASSTPEAAIRQAEAVADEAVATMRGGLPRLFSRGLGGVLCCGVFAYFAASSSPGSGTGVYGYRWIRRKESSPLDAPPRMVDALDALLFG